MALIKNQLSETNIGGYAFSTAVGSLRWTPTDRTDVTALVYWSDDEIDVPAMTAVAANCEDRGDGRLQNYCGEVASVGVNDLGTIQDAIGERRDLLRGNLSVNWEADSGATLQWLNGYSKTEHVSAVAGSRGGLTTFVYSDFLTGGTSSFETGLLQPNLGTKIDELSSELRWTSPADQRVRYSFGGHYYNVEQNDRDSTVIATTQPPFGFVGFCPCLQTPGFAIPFLGDNFNGWFSPDGGLDPDLLFTGELDAWAAFGYLEADFTEQLTGRLELRYADEEKTQFDNIDGPVFNDTWNFLTYRASLDYKLNDDWMLYGTVGTGAKSGGFDAENTESEGLIIKTYDEEENISYELGAKATLAGGKVYTDVAVFFIDWTDIVLPNIDDTFVPPETFSQNSGQVSVFGVEWSLRAAFSERWTGQFGLTWRESEFDHAVMDSFSLFPSFAPDGDVSGQTVLRQSDTQANASLTYTAPAGDSWEWYLRGDVFHRGKSFVGAPNQAIVPARNTANLRLGFESEGWELVIWSENIFDDDAPSAAFRDVFFSNTADGVTSPPNFSTFFPWRLTVSPPPASNGGCDSTLSFLTTGH